MDVFCTVIASMSPQKVCGSIAIKIPVLWPRAVMVGPRPRVLLTPPLADIQNFLKRKRIQKTESIGHAV